MDWIVLISLLPGLAFLFFVVSMMVVHRRKMGADSKGDEER